MSPYGNEYRQPWRRVDLAGERCRLQVLDPATTLELEPVVTTLLGDAAALVIVAPGKVGQALLRAAGLPSGDMERVTADPIAGPRRTTDLLTTSGALVVAMLTRLGSLDPGVVRDIFERFVFERLAVNDELVVDARDYAALGWSPRWKWHAMALQLRQTFGPLWTRSPYEVRAKDEASNVAEPTGVPAAVRYAANLASQGYAASADDILHEWTPVRMIEVIEEAAYTAARTREIHEKP